MDGSGHGKQAAHDERARALPSLLLSVCAAAAVVVACVVGLVPAVRALSGGPAPPVSLAWDATHGPFVVGLDALSAFFLVPVLGLSALAAVYGGSYLLPYRHAKSLTAAWFFFGAFVGGMVLVLVARTAVLFLMAWEVMSLSAYFLVTFEHEKAEARRAGWVYLIATHLGVAFLIATFTLLGRQAGRLEFEAFQTMPPLGAGAAGVVFVLALVGFGAKAGLVPFHVWLPEAHPAAPSHVSALMSAVMIKMGLYGLLRILSFLGPPAPWWGPTLAGVGLLTALLGIGLALHQRDLKRVLAYSSIENMGLIVLSLGVGLWGWSSDQPAVAALGVAGALLHVWNHALMKGLLFFAAGSVLHGTGTKDMERLGGLLKRMPWTGAAMMFGAVALAALPPLNGFVSKWMIYLGLIQQGLAAADGGSLAALLAVGALALIGGQAVLAFVRLTGIVLLGTPRSEAAQEAHESSPWMLAPMLILVVLCLVVATAPGLVVDFLSPALDQVHGRMAGGSVHDRGLADAPLFTLGTCNAWTLAVAGLVAAGFFVLAQRGGRAMGPTWGCGYVRPTPRMQYTGRSFAEMMAEFLLPRFLRPRTGRRAPRGLFPSPGEFHAESPDPVSRKIYEPFFRRWADRFSRLRVLQQGKVHVYLVYIMLVVVLTLAWLSLRTWWGAS